MFTISEQKVIGTFGSILWPLFVFYNIARTNDKKNKRKLRSEYGIKERYPNNLNEVKCCCCTNYKRCLAETQSHRRDKQ